MKKKPTWDEQNLLKMLLIEDKNLYALKKSNKLIHNHKNPWKFQTHGHYRCTFYLHIDSAHSPGARGGVQAPARGGGRRQGARSFYARLENWINAASTSLNCGHRIIFRIFGKGRYVGCYFFVEFSTTGKIDGLFLLYLWNSVCFCGLCLLFMLFDCWR